MPLPAFRAPSSGSLAKWTGLHGLSVLYCHSRRCVCTAFTGNGHFAAEAGEAEDWIHPQHGTQRPRAVAGFTTKLISIRRMELALAQNSRARRHLLALNK